MLTPMQQFEETSQFEGYSEQIQEVIKHELTCCVCQMIMQSPIFLNCPARHVLCVTCTLNIDNRCPLDRATIDKNKLIEGSSLDHNRAQFEQVVQSLFVTCREQQEIIHKRKQHLASIDKIQQIQISRFLELQCKWSGSLRQYMKHKEHCIDQVKVCEHCYQHHGFTEDVAGCPVKLTQNQIILESGPDENGCVYSFDPFNEEDLYAFNPPKINIQQMIIETPPKPARQLTCVNEDIVCEFGIQIITCDIDDPTHLSEGCPFELISCNKCSLLYFRFYYKHHIEEKCHFNKNLKKKVQDYKDLPERTSGSMLRIYHNNVEVITSLIKFMELVKLNIRNKELQMEPTIQHTDLGCSSLRQEHCFGLLNLWLLFSVGKFKVDHHSFTIVNKDLIVNKGQLFFRKVKLRDVLFEDLVLNMRQRFVGLQEVRLKKKNSKQKTYSFYAIFSSESKAKQYQDRIIVVQGVKLKGIACSQSPDQE